MQELNPMDTRAENGGTGKGLSIAAMVVGIVGVVTILLGAFLWPLLCGIIALVLSNIAKKNGQQNSMQKAGKICGIVSLIAGIILLVITIAAVVAGLSIAGSAIANAGDIAANSENIIAGFNGYYG